MPNIERSIDVSVLAQPLTDGTVSVRRLEPRDAGAFVAGSEDEQVRRFGHLPVAEYTEQVFLDQLHGVIADGLRDGSLAVLAIADAGTDEFLGSITLFDVDLSHETVETGFWLTPLRGSGCGAACCGARRRLGSYARYSSAGRARRRGEPGG